MNDAASWLIDQHALRAPTPTAARRPAAAGRHRAHRIVHERQPRRPREEQGHRRRDDKREGEHAAVEPDLADAAGEPGVYAIRRFRPETANPRPSSAADDRQHEVFGEQLTPQERRWSAERGADAHLALALHRAASA